MSGKEIRDRGRPVVRKRDGLENTIRATPLFAQSRDICFAHKVESIHVPIDTTTQTRLFRVRERRTRLGDTFGKTFLIRFGDEFLGLNESKLCFDLVHNLLLTRSSIHWFVGRTGAEKV